MKTKLILGGLLAFAAAGHAQWLTTGSDIYNDYSTYPGNIGIDNFIPQDKLDIWTYDNNPSVGGLTVRQKATNGSAAIHLSPDNTGGASWAMYSLGNNNHIAASNAGDFIISNNTSTAPFLISNSTGNVGIGTTAPTARLYVEESAAPTAGIFSAKGNFGGAVVTTGVYGAANRWNMSTSTWNEGVLGTASSDSPYYGSVVGVMGQATNTRYSFGGH